MSDSPTIIYETAGPVAAKQATIDKWFAHGRMQDIVAALQADGSELAQATLKTSPSSGFSFTCPL